MHSDHQPIAEDSGPERGNRLQRRSRQDAVELARRPEPAGSGDGATEGVSGSLPVEGGVRLSEAERVRRHRLLQELLDEGRLDALVLVANDYRGHKGSLRWVADYNLGHRHGFALVAPGREPELVLPQNLAMGPLGWDVPTRYAKRAARGLVNALAEIGRLERVGIVGLGEVMRISDYALLREAFPSTEFIDASQAFERVRAVKSDEEVAGARESTYIAEQCFRRLLEIARPGMTERQIGAEMYRVSYELGGEDPLFLCLRGTPGTDGTITGGWSPPRDSLLPVGEQFSFSFELIGPLGYWMEFSRMVVFGPPTDTQRRMNRAVAAGMEAAAQRMVPGASADEVQRDMLETVEEHGARSTYWSGHGIGQDVIEEPWIGREVVDSEVAVPWDLAANMVLSMHPYVADRSGRGMGYMANTYVVTEDGGASLSAMPLEIYEL
jgi:Xaa-Pro aminopeptidase